MNEHQLRELIQLAGKLGLTQAVQRYLNRDNSAAEPDELGEPKPTGLKRFFSLFRRKQGDDAVQPGPQEQPTTTSTQQFSASPQNRIDDIIRSVMPDWTPAAGSEPSESPSGALASTITGSIERQVGVSTGVEPPVKQPQVPGPVSSSTTPTPAKEPSKKSNAMDAFQLLLDGIGVVDPTPIADGANAIISLGRAFITDPERRKEHLQNAAISGVSMIPYVGDFAKIAKLPRAAKTVQRTAKAVRGVDRAADGAKVMTAAEKRAARGAYRETAEQVTGQVLGSDSGDSSTAQSVTVPQAAGGGSSQPPTSNTPVMSPSPGPDNNGGRQERADNEEGVEEYYSWRESIKDSGKKLADFAGALGKGAIKVAGFVEGLRLLNTGVLALNRDLAAYDGQIANAYAKSDAADILRDMRKAGALSGPLSGLAAQQTELKDKISEAIRPVEVVSIKVLEELTRLTNDTLDFMGTIISFVPGLREALDLYKSLNNQEAYKEGTAWNQFFQDVSDGKFDGKRPAFLNPKTQILNDIDHNQVFGPP